MESIAEIDARNHIKSLILPRKIFQKFFIQFVLSSPKTALFGELFRGLWVDILVFFEVVKTALGGRGGNIDRVRGVVFWGFWGMGCGRLCISGAGIPEIGVLGVAKKSWVQNLFDLVFEGVYQLCRFLVVLWEIEGCF